MNKGTSGSTEPAHHGTILTFNSGKGHGCGLVRIDGRKVKIHINNIDLPTGGGFIPIEKGQKVRCDVLTTEFGEEAVNVQLV